MKKTVTLFASVGSLLEYFDFVVYAMLSVYLGKLFFPSNDASVQLMHTFLIFALGYMIRPLGGILLGVFADYFGRKSIFLAIMLAMAIATLLIGSLPTYQQIGIAAPLLLIFFRLIQGLSFGAELPGAITILCENTPKSKHSAHCSFVISSTTIGSILASAMLFLIMKAFTEQEVLSFAWRIPFLFGGCLGILLFFFRKKYFNFATSNNNDTAQSLKQPIIEILKHHFGAVMLGIGAMLFPASLIIMNLYLPAYFSQYLNVDQSDIYLSMTISLLWAAIILPIVGYLADKFGKIRLFIIGALIFIFMSNTLLKYLLANNLTLYMLLYQTFIAIAISSYLPVLTELFNTSSRYTGVSFCYNLAYTISALLPIFVSYLMKRFPQLFILPLCLSGVALLSLLSASAVYKVKQKIIRPI